MTVTGVIMCVVPQFGRPGRTVYLDVLLPMLFVFILLCWSTVTGMQVALTGKLAQPSLALMCFCLMWYVFDRPGVGVAHGALHCIGDR